MMLKRFSVENYKNFREKITLELSSPRNYSFNQSLIKNNIINKAMIVGRSGYGKTNLGFALFDIVSNLTDYPVDQIQMDPRYFMNGFGDKDFVEFTYVFDHEGKELIYEYRKSESGMVISERLSENGNIILDWDGKKIVYWDGPFKMEYDRKSRTSNTRSALRFVYYNSANVDGPVSYVMDFVSHMLYFKSDVTGNTFIGFMNRGETLADYITNNGLVSEFNDMLNEYSDADIKLGVITDAEGKKVLVQEFGDKKMFFYNIASSGTKLFMLFYYWYKHTNNMSFLYMDEFDSHYHYSMAEGIVRLITSQSGYQTIFTTHNTSLLSSNIMRPDCCFLLDQSGLKCLSDRTSGEIRLGNNIEKLYRSGEFDGPQNIDHC